MSMQLAELEVLKLTELYKLAKKHQIPYYGTLKKKNSSLQFYVHKLLKVV